MSTTLEILHTGGVIVDRTLPYHRPADPPLSWTHILRGRGDLVTAPVSAYLIENSRGLTLIDTGWHPVNRGRLGQIANLRHQYPVNKADLPDGQAIDEQLEERGIRPRDLDLVLMSHLHCDHADGLRLVGEAPRILVSRPEAEGVRASRPMYLPHEWDGVDLRTFSWNTPVGPYGAGYDVFGDGSLVMVAVPGHSRGLCATIVRGNECGPHSQGRVEGVDAPGRDDGRAFHLLTSDAGYGRPSFDQGLRPSVVVSAAQAERSLAWVRRVEHDPRCLGLIANHDPEVEPGVRTF
ncbi:N-acyl homoserine lactonase family protein [Actinomyces israelii]|uniref:N-acyl homoserine lactonase family protein n=1 Tax=Actinomyces israelii TaxID=1659 RepID=UPI002356C090|nr:N-acyl homoserine lactonase family protein [Actinomyces israelii]